MEIAFVILKVNIINIKIFYEVLNFFIFKIYWNLKQEKFEKTFNIQIINN